MNKNHKNFFFPYSKANQIKSVADFDTENMKYYIKHNIFSKYYHDTYEMIINAGNVKISFIFLYKNGFMKLTERSFTKINNNINKHIGLNNLSKSVNYIKLIRYITFLTNRLSKYDDKYKSPCDVFAYIHNVNIDNDILSNINSLNV